MYHVSQEIRPFSLDFGVEPPIFVRPDGANHMIWCRGELIEVDL